MQDFSIKQDIKETIEELGLDLDVNGILSEVLMDELLLTTISMCIYETLSNKTSNEEIKIKLNNSRNNLVEILNLRNIL